MNDDNTSPKRSLLTAVDGRIRSLLEQLLPWLVLALLLRYSYALFVQAPYSGLLFRIPDGMITDVYVDDDRLRPGDRLRQVGSVAIEEMAQRNPPTYFFKGAQRGELIPLDTERNQQAATVTWHFPGFTWAEMLDRFSSPWWLAYVFWLGGTFTMLLVRPRDERWRLLTSFNYLTAIWLAAGTGSLWNLGQSRGVFRAAVWLSVPVALHLHWVFPDRLRPLPRWFRRLGYLLAGGLAIADLFYLPPANLYWVGFLLVLGGSALIVLWRLLFRPAQRRELGLLLGAILLALIPPGAVAAANLLGSDVPGFVATGTLLALPTVPGAYFYILYRRQLGRRQARARRLLRIYLAAIVGSALFLFLVNAAVVGLQLDPTPLFLQLTVILFFGLGAILGFAPFFSLAALADPPRERGGDSSSGLRLRANRLLTPFFFINGGILLLALSLLLLHWWLDVQILLLAVALLAFLWGRFAYRPLERAVDRYLLGIHFHPSHLLEGFAERITTTLDRDSLTRLLREEILPSLLVRESALLHIRENGQMDLILSHGIEQLPKCTPPTLPQFPLGVEGHPLPADIPAWVRVLIPLRLDEVTIGCWLWGARDPDDLYRPQDVRTLQALADQTAIALTNILQTENLRALYRTHIDAREEERTRLALTLHDEILNELAVLNMYVEEAAPPFHEAYHNIRARLRLAISDLRPAMLNYGLGTALEELVEDWRARVGDEVELIMALDPDVSRYPLNVEGHLFRIVQQALTNAIQHARASTIRLEGSLKEESVRLSVTDDGVGFPTDVPFTLPALLARKHFGLVGMNERAALVGAELQISAAPQKGTTVVVFWSHGTGRQPPIVNGDNLR